MLTYYEQVITRLILVPGHGGRFELRVDGEVIFSKHAAKRHIEPGESVRLLKDRAARLEEAGRTGY